MAKENVNTSGGTGPQLVVDNVSGERYQIIKLASGAVGSATLVSDAAPLPVDDAGGTLSVDDGGGNISVDDGGNVLSVDDAGSSLTVDSAQLPASLGKQTNGASLSITLASDHGGIAVTDGSGSLTVDNAVLTALSKAEDAVHGSGDQGIMVLSVRKDTATALAGADGDYQPLVTNASGQLRVTVGSVLGVTAKGQATAANSLPVVLASDSMPPGTWTSAVGSASGTNDVSFTAASGKEWRVKNVRVSLVASATAGTRQIVVQLIESATVYATFYMGCTQIESETRVYEFYPGAPDSVTFRADTVAYHPLPIDLIMPQGMSFRVFDLNNADATSDAMTVRYLVDVRTNTLLP